MIETEHWYKPGSFCHEYWECEDPNHTMFIKFNRVQIENWNPSWSDLQRCAYDWARFGWEVDGEVFSETVCVDQSLDDQGKILRLMVFKLIKRFRSIGKTEIVP